MFSERGWMSVGLITAPYFTIVWFIRCVDMRVFLTITGVSKPAITSIKLTLEGFLS